MTNSNAQRRLEIERFFIDANLEGAPRVVVSPSGRHRLTIRTYRTLPGRWSYTRGTVTRSSDGALVCDIQRNFSTFHHSFVTKDSHEYLITGRSYLSQTIIDLDTGAEYEPPGDDTDSAAFCWSHCTLSPDGNTLAVNGCPWACPYEYRFYDFTDPALGWAELPIMGSDVVEDTSRRSPEWLDALTIDCHQADHDSVPQERTRFQRRGNQMIAIEHEVSDEEQARRADEARLDHDYEAWWASFRTTDPLYLRLADFVQLHNLSTEPPRSQWRTHRIFDYFRRATPHASADFEWDVDAAIIKVQTYDPSGSLEHTFPASLPGLESALALLAHAFRT